MPPRTKAAIADTNVLLRYLMGDDPTQSPAAVAFMSRVEQGAQEIDIRECVLTETVWTLRSYFQVPRQEVAEKLGKLMAFPGVRSPGKKALVNALVRYGASNADFVDCLLAAAAEERQVDVITFDRTDFAKLTSHWRTPA